MAARFALHYAPIAVIDGPTRPRSYREGKYDVGLFCMSSLPCGSIRVVVLDVLTGRAPPSAVALRVTRDSILDWDLGSAQDAPLLALAAGEGEGPFSIEVAADGYALWYREDVRVEIGEDGLPHSPPLKVWLILVDPQP